MGLPVTRRRPESTPSEPAIRRRAVDQLAAEIEVRELSGERLRCFVWNVRARGGTDLCVDLLLALLAKRPSG